MRGRKRKPTHLHVIEGTLNVTKHKDRAHEPSSNGPLGPPPGDWPEAGKLIWAEVASIIPPHVATRADRLIVELTCRVLISLRAGKSSPAMWGQLRGCLAS